MKNIKSNTLPAKLICTIKSDNRPVQGLMIEAVLKTSNKNNYSIIFGPTNNEGVATIDYEELIKQTNSELELGVMDYNKLEDVYDGNIDILVMSVEELKAALGAYEIYKDVAYYPINYSANLESAINILLDMKNNIYFQIDVVSNKFESTSP
jgi:hypothetical protein